MRISVGIHLSCKPVQPPRPPCGQALVVPAADLFPELLHSAGEHEIMPRVGTATMLGFVSALVGQLVAVPATVVDSPWWAVQGAHPPTTGYAIMAQGADEPVADTS